MTIPDQLKEVQYAVTNAAGVLANLSQSERLEDRDRRNCQAAYELLVKAENVLYPTHKEDHT
jgi:hypothetical protein